MITRLLARAAGPARASRAARAVRRDRLTYLSWAKLRSLEQAPAEVRRDAVRGDFVEAGDALGGSGILLASRLDRDRSFHGYDVFGMIPPPGERDGSDSHERYAAISAGRSRGLGGDRYYGYMDDLLQRVQRSFARHGQAPAPGRIELHAGLFEDTLHPPGPVALAHIDSDWYDPVRLCLERIHEWLSPGGIVVVDDYNDYRGCTAACHDFLATATDVRILRARPHLVLHRLAA